MLLLQPSHQKERTGPGALAGHSRCSRPGHTGQRAPPHRSPDHCQCARAQNTCVHQEWRVKRGSPAPAPCFLSFYPARSWVLSARNSGSSDGGAGEQAKLPCGSEAKCMLKAVCHPHVSILLQKQTKPLLFIYMKITLVLLRISCILA